MQAQPTLPYDTWRTCLLSFVCSTAETVAKEMPGLISMGTSESASCKQTEDFSQVHSRVRAWGLQGDAPGSAYHTSHTLCSYVCYNKGRRRRQERGGGG